MDQFIDCVTSSTGKCVVTNEAKIINNYQGDIIEWKIKPLNFDQDVINAQSYYNYKVTLEARNTGCLVFPLTCGALIGFNDNVI